MFENQIITEIIIFPAPLMNSITDIANFLKEENKEAVDKKEKICLI